MQKRTRQPSSGRTELRSEGMIKNVIIKVTLGCNIACTYCYVRHNRDGTGTKRIMSDATLEVLIAKIGEYVRATPEIDRFVFYWHGGEPLLAGPSFFRRSYELQRQHMPPSLEIVNTIQTNAIMLNDTWVQLIEELGYGLCLSLDGPRDIHDVWRRSTNDRGTYEVVLRGISALKESDIGLSVLAVITPEAVRQGRRIYKHFRELGFTWMDFMYPFYSRIDNTLGRTIDPAEWGQFYKDVFDAWIEEENPNVDIRLLHDLCMLQLGGKTSMCVSSADCSYVVTVDPSGDVYICDDLLAYADSLLGNIHCDSLFDIAERKKLTRLALKDTLFGEQCRQCDYFEYCKGGCTLFRARAMDDFSAPHYFCEAQKAIISHIQGYFRSLQSDGTLPTSTA